MLPRMLRLHPSTYQRLVRLSKEAEKDGAYRVAKRLRAVLLNAEGIPAVSWRSSCSHRDPRCPSGFNVIRVMEWTACWKAIDQAVHPNSPRNSNNSWEISWTAALSLTGWTAAFGHRP